jgi:hypothetical protein
MELTFKTDIGSFLKSENKSSEGWTIMDIYDNTKIIIYVKNNFCLNKIFEVDTKKQLTKKDIEKINIQFKYGFHTHIMIPNRGRTNISNYDNYINSANKFFSEF